MKTMMSGIIGIGLVAAVIATSGWHPVAIRDRNAKPITARIIDTSGRVIGTVEVADDDSGHLRLRIRVHALSPGLHGIHWHAVGVCAPPGFGSAGGHFDPSAASHQRQHGLANPLGPHAGDLPNLVVNDAGVGEWAGTTDRVTLSAGSTSLLDADGSALVIHASADDQSTDPSGNSGARIACAVLSRSGG